jgi:predicted HTH domain antitoxin
VLKVWQLYYNEEEVFIMVMTEVLTPQRILDLIETLTRSDQQWIMRQLSQSLHQTTAPLPAPNLLEEALELYFDDQCSLGRAAELAGVTRWELIDVLKTRNISIPVYSRHSARQIDELAKRLEQVGVL